MDNSGKSSIPPIGGVNRDKSDPIEGGIRPSIHNARAAGASPRVPSVVLPKINSGLPRPSGIQAHRPLGSVSQPVQQIPTAEPVSTPEPVTSVSEPVSEPVEPVAAPSPAPAMPNISSLPEDMAMDATCAIMTEDEDEEESVVSSTKALTPEELEAAGLPPEPEELSEDPEIDVDAPIATLPVGMKIDDRYEIQGVLGVGGFATVYRAHHLTIDRDVALKVMDLKKGVDPSYSQRFFREAKIAAKIHHNNVVSIYDFGHVTETGQPYIAMEMLHGHDLSHELTEAGPLSPKRMFVLFRPVLEALGQGHRLGIVHKDLKPENLYLVDPRGQHELMKVLDFGVARINSSEVAKLTSAGQLLGTPRYLAPEYIKQQLVSPAIDVYQMALIISEALTGIPAVSGDPFHAMMLHCSGQLQIAGFLLEGRVGEVFRKAISINPNERYPDCDAFAAALDEIQDCFESNVPLKGGAPQMTPESHVSSKMTAMPFSNQTTGENNGGVSAELYQPTAKKSSAPIIFICIFAVLLAGAFVAYFMYTKQQQQQQPEIKTETVEKIVEVQKEDKEFVFEFDSNPSGAQVKLNGTVPVCDKTPCSYTFKESMLGMPQSITFTKEGYRSGLTTICISDDVFKDACTFSHEKTKGKVNLTLDKADPTELEVMIVYTPANVKVTNRKNKIVCETSPCKFILKQSDGGDTLTFSLAGYTTITKDLFYSDMLAELKKSGLTSYSLKIDLKTAPPKSAKRPSAPTGGGEAAPAPAPAPAPTPKPKREEIKW